ncbi:(d)CMP kinase [Desulforamulus aquiferis]|uniref:Cytidylate kinase n=1 Tax=Desulforamulus aquiferis TaxID=1397668 RepID=A0AAW7ZAH4_9FIRM|nr:(d)CMP kinase [Desulforamulus aquiferis]MDO7786485.1 (d)CMP kinase [Desulforamulus aquiferis]RYD02935.1 hypothetical protein N752_22375 [Desulforamulus aquiferis]
MSNHKTIAIDGPAGAGKSTVARMVAQKLGLLYIDTGAMYRAITLKALREGIRTDNPAALTELAGRTNVELVAGSKQQVIMDGEDVTEAVRYPEVCLNVSKIAQISGVRAILVEQQRRLAEKSGVVMDGRDIGTVVLPRANYKFFLTASPEERARRRASELATKGYTIDIEKLTREIQERDYTDSHRAVSPLVPAADAIVIDSSGLGIESVVNMMIDLVEKDK